MQARKYKKMTDQEKYERQLAAKQRRGEALKSKTSSAKVTPVKKASSSAAERSKAAKSESARTSADIKKKKAISKENDRVKANRVSAKQAKPGAAYQVTLRDGSAQERRRPKAIKKKKA